MSNYSILFSIKIGGPSQNYLILLKAIESIFSKIHTENFQILIFYESNNEKMVHYIEGLKNSKIIKNKVENYSWFNWMIKSSEYAKNFDYLYLMHDDIFFLTNNFDQVIHNTVKNSNEIGIITLKDMLYEDGYYKSQFRSAFYLDTIYDEAPLKGLLGEFHKQKPFWHLKNAKFKRFLNHLNLNKFVTFKNLASRYYFDKEKMILPTSVIKIHGGWNDLMIFKKANLNLFRNICDFQVPYGLNSDEDISLEFLKIGLKNIFIPNVSYKCNYEFNFTTTRSYGLHSMDKDKCRKIFIDKWGFDQPTKLDLKEKVSIIKKARELHGKEIVWTSDFYSYDYQLFNNK
jgi:hypothetical protein